MIFKLLTIILLFFGVAMAMGLMMRLTRIQQQIAERTKELQRNNDLMAQQRRDLERLAAAEEAQNGERDIKS